MNARLNPDAFAFLVLQGKYREQMDLRARKLAEATRIRANLERIEADVLTAAERATSIMETLLKLQQPVGEQVPA